MINREFGGVVFSLKSKDSPSLFYIDVKKEKDVILYNVSLSFPNPQQGEILLSYEKRIPDIARVFLPSFLQNDSLRANWYKSSVTSCLASNTPFLLGLSVDYNSLISVCCDELIRPIRLGMGVVEETGNVEIELAILNRTGASEKDFHFTIRERIRKSTKEEAIDDVLSYWEKEKGLHFVIPRHSYYPIYSTWYNFHQNLEQDKLLEEMKIAASLGLKTLIIDDGWQTDNGDRGYAYCGDWEVSKSRFPDLASFVKSCHELGIKVVLWVGLPWVGGKSRAIERFLDKTLYAKKEYFGDNFFAFDPRYGEVRQYLVDKLTDLVRIYDIDGFKLDFIDSFSFEEKVILSNDKMDIKDLDIAVLELLREIRKKVNELKPDALFEYRQSYINPLLDETGTLIRVADCPLDPVTNRQEILNLRLSTRLAVTSDMVVINETDDLDIQALHLYSTLLSVPQISLVLKDLSPNLFRILQAFLNYQAKHQELILEGKLKTAGDGSHYLSASLEKGDEVLTCLYEPTSTKLSKGKHHLINMTMKEELIVSLEARYQVAVYNKYGDMIDSYVIGKGLVSLSVPPFSILEFSKI